jgi:peroxiredoxin
MATLTTGTAAPESELIGLDDKRYALAEALGRGPVLAVFFKVACPTCQFTVPFVERLYQQFGKAGGQVWGISQDNREDTQQFAQRFGLSFPILIDEKPYRVSREFGLKFVPAVFLIGEERGIQVTGDGFSRADMLEIQKLLANQLSVTPPPLFQPGERVPEYKPG